MDDLEIRQEVIKVKIFQKLTSVEFSQIGALVKELGFSSGLIAQAASAKPLDATEVDCTRPGASAISEVVYGSR